MNNKISLETVLDDGYEDYFVYRDGRVESNKSSKHIILKPDIDKDGYHIYRLYNNKTKKNKAYKGHRLVAMAFIDNSNNLPLVNHKNGIKSDNRVENLEWCTNSQNIKHAYENNLAIPYIRGYKILDIHTNEIVCKCHSYDFLMELTGFKYSYLTEIHSKGLIFFDGYKILKENSVDFSDNTLYNNVFIKRKINQRQNPIKYRDVVYESVNKFCESGIIKKSEYNKARKLSEKNGNRMYFNGYEIEKISLYEYVNY